VTRYAQLEAERELLRTADPSLVQRVKDLELEAAELRKQLRWAETPYTASAEMGLRDEARKYATPHNLFGLRVRLRRAEQAIRKAANRRVSKEDLERAVERETRDLRKQVAAAEEAKAALIAKVADIDAERAAVEREMLEP
jgi:hypothetical protein